MDSLRSKAQQEGNRKIPEGIRFDDDSDRGLVFSNLVMEDI